MSTKASKKRPKPLVPPGTPKNSNLPLKTGSAKKHKTRTKARVRDDARKNTKLELKRGPGKKRKAGGHEMRWTTHKKRCLWFQSRSAWPNREPAAKSLVVARAAVQNALAPHPSAKGWQLAGPSNIGGRVTSVACDPANADRLWIGAAGGGVWHSTDGGKSWMAQWHQEPVLNIGALAVDPNATNTIYAGTGEANLSADSYPGVGLYRSQDGGKNWSLIASPDNEKIPSRIGTVVVNPHNSQHILLGGVSHANDSSDGLHQSRDGGTTWVRAGFASTQAYRCHAIVFHPVKPGVVFATASDAGSRSGIWTSTDHGQVWTQLSNGLPTSSKIGRGSLAISASNPDVMYALFSTSNDKVLGVYRSTNGGASWKEVSGGQLNAEGQMSYGNTIAVHPSDPQHVLCGGVDLHLTTDGGKHWTQATQWDAQRGTNQYAHADHHALLMPASRPGLVYDGNDGGLDVSQDGGTNWENRSNGLAITMFYDLDTAQTDSQILSGGAQDNGTIMTTDGTTGGFGEILGGDGGWTIIDPGDEGHFYASYQFMGLYRWRNWTPSHGSVAPPAPKSEKDSVWMAYSCFDPKDTKIVYVGSTRVWKTVDDAQSWTAVSDFLDGSAISAIEVAMADRRFVYVGTENGGIFASKDGGKNWTGNLLGLVPGRVVTRIETSPQDAKTVFATFGNFGTAHLLRSNDGGIHWTEVGAGQLPDVPHHAVMILPDRPNTMLAGTDAGVFISEDLGATWRDLSGNLPASMVVDIVYHENDKILFAATYGRSIWRLAI